VVGTIALAVSFWLQSITDWRLSIGLLMILFVLPAGRDRRFVHPVPCPQVGAGHRALSRRRQGTQPTAAGAVGQTCWSAKAS
jgi:hypothetical protein